MEKSWSVLGWILLGAFAVALGSGYFLYQANRDRARLVNATEQAKKQSEELAAASKKLADEANKKLDTASKEIRDAQEKIRKYEEEQKLLAKAAPLIKTRASSAWKEWVNIPLGFTIRLPAEHTNAGNELFFDFGWIKIQPYDPGREFFWRENTSSTGDIIYFIDGRLLVGTRGSEWILRDQSAGSSTVLIWAKPVGSLGEKNVLEALATLTFRR